MKDDAPFGISADAISSVVRAKNKILIALGLVAIIAAVLLLIQ